MNIEQLREYCLSMPNAEEGFPFGGDTLVFKINSKMFLLVGLENEPLQFNVKCDAEKAVELREQYDCILPGYHMHKKYWNTIVVDGTLSTTQLQGFIKDSFDLVKGKKK